MNKKNSFVLQIPKKNSILKVKEKTFLYKGDLSFFDSLKFKGENLKNKKKLLQLNKKIKLQVVEYNPNSGDLYSSINNKIVKNNCSENIIKLRSIFLQFYSLL